MPFELSSDDELGLGNGAGLAPNDLQAYEDDEDLSYFQDIWADISLYNLGEAPLDLSTLPEADQGVVTNHNHVGKRKCKLS